MTGSYRLGELAERLGGQVVGDADELISGLGALPSAEPGQLSHLSNPAYRRDLPKTKASAVILRDRDLALCPTNAIVVADPYFAFALASRLWERSPRLDAGIHASAQIDASAAIDRTAHIGPGVVIGPETKVAGDAAIHANAVIGARCRLDEGVRILANATLYDDVKIGARSVGARQCGDRRRWLWLRPQRRRRPDTHRPTWRRDARPGRQHRGGHHR